MADQRGSHSQASRGSEADQRAEPVRSRWTPKQEQILILESIFNSGMVNPPKDETVRIRKLLEKFGAVGDANVFYWFQNRRSRSRRRQRQIQASLSAAGDPASHGGGGAINHFENSNVAAGNYAPNPSMSNYVMNTGVVGPGTSSAFGLVGNDAASDGLLSFSGHPGGSSFFGPPETSNLQFQSAGGSITLFINGVATEVGSRRALNVKGMFGGDYGLVHSSGARVEVNDHGFVVQSLQHEID
ncbi:hypothetical protein ACS0TY_025100 [Phlomoides rotata]